MNLWAYGTSPHGLGLDAEVLWSLTPREFGALKRVHEESRLPAMWMHAALQATLHNAHFRGEHQPAFEAKQFIPEEYRPAVKPGEEPWRRTMSILKTKFEAQALMYQAEWDRAHGVQ